MLNFTLGPVQSSDRVRAVGAENVPYFRTPEFSEVMLENEAFMRRFAEAGQGSRAVFLTGSGTAAMEAAVLNVFTSQDKVLIVNGGSFGQRFAELCRVHGVPYAEIRLEAGKTLTEEALAQFDQQGYTGFLVNIHEASTGVYYDPELIARFCRANRLFLVVDAISSFLADSFCMERLGVDVMITGSQKALACPPGVSVLVLSERAVRRAEQNQVASLYFDLKPALADGSRGQTPFTPAVGTLLQINARLHEIAENGGVAAEQARISSLAKDFRSRISGLPLAIFSDSLSNAATPLMPRSASAHAVFTLLKEEYGIWVCPNGGELQDKVFRVGHMGALTVDDNSLLLDALWDLNNRNLL